MNAEKPGRPEDADHPLEKAARRRLDTIAAAHRASIELAKLAGRPGAKPPADTENLRWRIHPETRQPTALIAADTAAADPTVSESGPDGRRYCVAATPADAARVADVILMHPAEQRSRAWRTTTSTADRTPADGIRRRLRSLAGEQAETAGASIEIRTVPNLDGTASDSGAHVGVAAVGWAGAGTVETIECLRAARERAVSTQPASASGTDTTRDDELYRAACWAAGLARTTPAVRPAA